LSNKKVHTSDLIFGASIKSIRKILKLTQNQFAEPLSISGSYVSNIEKGEAMPSEAVIREVCTYYRINRDYLTTGTGDMFVTSSGIGISGGNTDSSIKGIGVGGGAALAPATGAAEHKKPPEILFAEGLLPQLSPDDLNEVIADMLDRIKKAKSRANDIIYQLTPDEKAQAIEELQKRIRMLEAQEGGILQTPNLKTAKER